MSTTRAWHLTSRPNGLPTMDNFALEESALPELQAESSGIAEVDEADYLEFIIHRGRGQLRREFSQEHWTAFIETVIRKRPRAV